MRKIEWIVLHTAGAYDSKAKRVVHQPVNVIRDYHMKVNGWRDIGYHWYVEVDGKGQLGRLEEHTGAHANGFNGHSLGLCVSGHGDYEEWNPAQLREVERKVAQWCRVFHIPAENVIGHREVGMHGAPAPGKTCPGRKVDMDLIRKAVAKRLADFA